VLLKNKDQCCRSRLEGQVDRRHRRAAGRRQYRRRGPIVNVEKLSVPADAIAERAGDQIK